MASFASGLLGASFALIVDPRMLRGVVVPAVLAVTSAWSVPATGTFKIDLTP